MQISNKLSDADLKELCFLTNLPKGVAEKITSGIDLFDELERRGKLGHNNYGYLKKLLEDIERKDLAGSLPSSGNALVRDFNSFTVTSWSHLPVDATGDALGSSSTTESERSILQCIFQHLSERDLENLVYIYTGKGLLPKCCEDKIKSSTKLLATLEEHGCLNYISLSVHLHQIGRVDLAQEVQFSVIWDVPAGFKGPSQSLKQYPSLQRLHFQVSMHNLSNFEENVDRWRKVLERACDELHPPYRLDRTKMQQMGFWVNIMMLIHKDAVIGILSSISSCFDSFLSALQVIEDAEELDVNQLKGLLKECRNHFEDIKRAVNQIRPGLIQDRETKTIDVDGKNAREACNVVSRLGDVMLRRHGMEEVVCLDAQLEDAKDDIYTLESVSYTAGNWLQMFPCLCILVYLNDLSPYAEALGQIVESHWDHIEQDYSIMSDIVGKKVLDELAHKLHKQPVSTSTGCSMRDSHIRTLRTSGYAVVILLAGKALNCSIDIERSGMRLAEFQLSDDQREFQVRAGIQINAKTTSAMKEVVRKFRRYVIESCNRLGDVGLKQCAKEILPEET